MAMNLEQISDAALALPAEARAALLDRLQASLFDHVPPEVKEAQIREVLRRREEVFAGKVRLIPGEEVEREARQLLNEISRVPPRGAR